MEILRAIAEPIPRVSPSAARTEVQRRAKAERRPELPDVQYQYIRMELARRRLYDFVKLMWPIVETRPFVGGWHMECICDHLEALLRGEIPSRNLLINMPPRHTKSLIVAVMFPAFAWLSQPQLRFLFSSYAETLSVRDSVKCRRILESPLYGKLLGLSVRAGAPGFSITSDQNTKVRYDNNRGGYRLATSVDGSNTGEGGDFLVVDDPNNVRDVESTVDRQRVLDWWDNVMATRLDDPKTGRRVVIQQRCHSQDLSGHIIEKIVAGKERWDVVVLPARYEGSNRISSSIGWEDPREVEGELLHPERIDERSLGQIEASLSIYGAAGQLQQRPVPREGGLFHIAGFDERFMDAVPVTLIVASARYWDKAASQKKGSAYSTGVLLHRLRNKTYLIEDVKRGRWAVHEREATIRATAALDALSYGTSITTYVEREPGSGGMESAQSTIANLAGFDIREDLPSGDKEARARPLASQVNVGNVWLLNRPWVRDFIAELEIFPQGFKDQVDAAAGAFNKVSLATEMQNEGGTW